jgi:hypothetical protein
MENASDADDQKYNEKVAMLATGTDFGTPKCIFRQVASSQGSEKSRVDVAHGTPSGLSMETRRGGRVEQVYGCRLSGLGTPAFPEGRNKCHMYVSFHRRMRTLSP